MKLKTRDTELAKTIRMIRDAPEYKDRYQLWVKAEELLWEYLDMPEPPKTVEG